MKLTEYKSKVRVSKTNDAREYRASFFEGAWHGYTNGKRIPIDVPVDITNKLKYIVSTRKNDHWPPGTIREHVPNRPTWQPCEFWTAFFEGMKFEADNRNGILYIDWDKHDKLLAKHAKERDKRAKGFK